MKYTLLLLLALMACTRATPEIVSFEYCYMVQGAKTRFVGEITPKHSTNTVHSSYPTDGSKSQETKIEDWGKWIMYYENCLTRNENTKSPNYIFYIKAKYEDGRVTSKSIDLNDRERFFTLLESKAE